MSDVDLSGCVDLVTGSIAGGIGRSTALTQALHGADVSLNYGMQRQGAAHPAPSFTRTRQQYHREPH